MVIAYRDLSGNNPTHHLLDRPVMKSAPATEYSTAITNCATVDQEFERMARAIYVATNGNVELVDYRGNTTIFVGLVAGTILDVQASGSRSAGTTATNIVPLF